MQRTAFAEIACPIARTADVIGDWWMPLVLRDLALGLTRFDAIQRDLGISRKVLTQRLDALVEHGVVERVAYQDNPPRHDYLLTEKGADLAMVLVAMKAWGDRWAPTEDGPPIQFRHEACGTVADPVVVCSGCGEPLHPAELTPVPGPGAVTGPGTAELPALLARRAAGANH